MSTPTLSVFTIGGSVVNLSAHKLISNSWTLNLDQPDEFEFSELDANLPGSYAPEQTVQVTVNGIPAFSGRIFSRHVANAGTGSITIGYRCLSLKYLAYMVPITAADGTGVMAFNLPPTDQAYAPNQAGLSVGQILTEVFNINASALSAIGISTDSTTTSQLATLTVVSPDPVYVQGPSLWSQVDQIMNQWYGSRFCVIILPSGLIRLVDTQSLTLETLTLGTDPVVLSAFSEDTSESYTQVVVRGRDLVIPAVASLSDGSLVDPNVTAEATWNLNDFLFPQGGFDQGSITSVSATQCTIVSDSPTQHVAANFWSGVQAQIALIDPLSTAITGYEYQRITANTAMAPGGSCVITFALPIGATGYTRYQIRGNTVGLSDCYRRYNITNTFVAQHLVTYFPYAVPFSPSQFAVEQTNFPISTITISNSGLPWQFSLPFEVVPFDGTTNGYVLFYAPIVQQFNSQQALLAGGSAVQKPVDVSVFIPYSKGALSVQSPSGGGFSGTAFSRFNVQRTLFRDYSTWVDPAQSSSIQMLADSILSTVNQVNQDGQITYYGQYTPALTPGSPIALSIAHFSQTTSYEALQAPCRSVTLEWPQSGSTQWITRISFSTRRQAYSGERLYLHANYQEGGGWFGALGGFEGASFQGISDASKLGSLGSTPAAMAPPSPGGYSPLSDVATLANAPSPGGDNSLSRVGTLSNGPPDAGGFTVL